MPYLDDFLKMDLLMRVRNNHALEHATLHVLQEKGLKSPLGGISDMGGFWIYGEVVTDVLFEASQEALTRLGNGESELAVHPNCGTNIAISGLAAGSLAWISMFGTQGKIGKKLRRLPIAILLGLIGYQIASPFGQKLQKQFTINADVQGLEIIEVNQHNVADRIVHRVATRLAR
ncbi:MAG: DUF6391 domain-containing protein [Pelolinea sp.]|nr:DUF6391 domain-containing protein [Pelolinea sp.]